MKLIFNTLFSFDLSSGDKKGFALALMNNKLSKLRTESIPENGAQHFSFNGILGILAPNTASLFVAVLIFIVENSCKALNVSL